MSISIVLDRHYRYLLLQVGSLFVKNHFNHESKVVALEMIHGIRESFNELLMENHWMDDATRLVAKDKARVLIMTNYSSIQNVYIIKCF